MAPVENLWSTLSLVNSSMKATTPADCLRHVGTPPGAATGDRHGPDPQLSDPHSRYIASTAGIQELPQLQTTVGGHLGYE